MIHALRTLRCTDAAERLTRFTSYADSHPKNGVAQYFAAREAWLQRNLALAYSYASRALTDDPDSFEMLAVCAEFHAERGDTADAVRLAKRLLKSERPDQFARRFNRLLSAPMLLFAPGRWREIDALYDGDAAIYDQWQQWAAAYLESHDVSVGVA